MWDLSSRRAVKPQQPSVPRQSVNKKGWDLVPGLEDAAALGVLLTDFGELQCKNGRKKAYFMPILDQRAKWVPDWRWGDSGTRRRLEKPWRWRNGGSRRWGCLWKAESPVMTKTRRTPGIDDCAGCW